MAALAPPHNRARLGSRVLDAEVPAAALAAHQTSTIVHCFGGQLLGRGSLFGFHLAALARSANSWALFRLPPVNFDFRNSVIPHMLAATSAM